MKVYGVVHLKSLPGSPSNRLSIDEIIDTAQEDVNSLVYGGVDGTREAIMALRSLRDMLGGVKDGSVSVKWDGAPAVICGVHPYTKRFFVGTKSVFNVNAKI